ncbi:MAG: hypothetical protein LC104_20590 [Bacteroidales bacterium]|nr:hypothetical protein [Bacteroidales bacterium]
MMQLMFGLLATWLGSTGLTTPIPATPAQPARQLADQAMHHVKHGDLDAAYATLIPHLTWPQGVEHLLSARDQAKKMREALSRNDAPMGEIEFLTRETVGHSLERYVYLEKWERTAMVWKFTFYRGREGWTLYAVDWSNTAPVIQQLFETSRK